MICIQQPKKNMQTNVKQRTKNYRIKKTIRCIFSFGLFRAEPLSDALRRALFNPHYVLSSPGFRLQILMVLEHVRYPLNGLDDLKILL